MKKSLVALKLQGVILCSALASLIGVLVVKQYTNDKVQVATTPDYKFNNYVDAFNITLTSYGFFNKLFPVICEM